MNIAIVGATGNVGRKLLEVIEKLNFEFSELYLIASDKSIGKKITFKNKTYSIVGLSDFDFSKVKIAFFSAGSAIAEKWAPIAAKKTIEPASVSPLPELITSPAVCAKASMIITPGSTACWGKCPRKISSFPETFFSALQYSPSRTSSTRSTSKKG